MAQIVYGDCSNSTASSAVRDFGTAVSTMGAALGNCAPSMRGWGEAYQPPESKRRATPETAAEFIAVRKMPPAHRVPKPNRAPMAHPRSMAQNDGAFRKWATTQRM